MSEPVDPEVRQLIERHLAAYPNSRSSKALRAMMEGGSVTTRDLNRLGYDHPPRAIGDARDAGIPVITERIVTADGRRMARYRLGRADDIHHDRHLGRSTLPKAFKQALLLRYGAVDAITGATLPPAVLQIDHRVPFRIAGDAGLAQRDTSAFMLLDASSQRAKSWSCEHCPNFLGARDPATCQTCFWAFPEAYSHIATREIRRTDIVWMGEDVPVHDRLRRTAKSLGISIQEMILRLARANA
ncbi:MAG: hypothetical protein ACP5NP_13945 [Acetobacteraceae bacterium]